MSANIKCGFFEAVYEEVIGEKFGQYCSADTYPALLVFLQESECDYSNCEIKRVREEPTVDCCTEYECATSVALITGSCSLFGLVRLT